MRDNAMKEFVKLAKAGKGALAKLVSGAVEAGIVVPSVLKAKLEEDGFTVQEKKRKVGVCVEVHHTLSHLESMGHKKAIEQIAAEERDPEAEADMDSTILIAYGFSSDAADALLQAMYAELREEAKDESK
jgi:hypothetical protein